MKVHVVRASSYGVLLHETQLVLTEHEIVVASSWFTPLRRCPNALGALLEQPLPDGAAQALFWSGFYLKPQQSVGAYGWTREAGALFCAIMEYGLLEGCSSLVVAAGAELLEHSVGAGWRVHPLGRPQRIAGQTMMAAGIEVSPLALENVRRACRQGQVFLPVWAASEPGSGQWAASPC